MITTRHFRAFLLRHSWACQVANGRCETISSTPVEINGKEYTASTKSMSYHAAENFCQALGKSLVTLQENCTAEELATIKANNYSGNCVGWTHTTGHEYWTSTKLSGCSSYYIRGNSSGGVLSYGWFYGGYYYALCR